MVYPRPYLNSTREFFLEEFLVFFTLHYFVLSLNVSNKSYETNIIHEPWVSYELNEFASQPE